MDQQNKTNTNKKILLVEDDAMLCDLYAELLKGEGYSTDQARDGDEALTLLTKGGYDLVLLDVVLPKQNAVEIMTHLTQNRPQNPNKKIVIMSNLYQDPLIEKLREFGITKHFVKSNLNPEEFLKNVSAELSA